MDMHFDSTTRVEYSSLSDSDLLPVQNPATGQLITTVAGCDAAAADRAVEASHVAFKSWRAIPALQRGLYLLKVADALEAHAEELATLLCLENGKPKQDARIMDVNFLVGIFRYFGGLAGKLPSEFHDRGNMMSRTVHQPFGVTVGILPFNWPPIHAGGKLAPALATGNTMILKPGDQAPLTAMRIVEIMQTVLPKDVVIVLPTKGTATPQALVKNPLVKLVSFTGSTAGGIAVAESGIRTLTSSLLELGGKNAFVVFKDADLDKALKFALEGAFFNKGEACTAASRLIVHESIYDEFCTRLSAAVKRLVVGDGMERTTHVGPVIDKRAQDRILSYIETGVREGAVIAAQAPLPTDPRLKEGCYVPPTLFTSVSRTMTIAKEEIFGPVTCAIPFSTEEEAISIANSVEFGLTGIIFSKDHETCTRVASKLDVGMIWINQYNRAASLGTPFGGTKMSGLGREHCLDTLREYTWVKTVHESTGIGEVGNWTGVAACFD